MSGKTTRRSEKDTEAQGTTFNLQMSLRRAVLDALARATYLQGTSSNKEFEGAQSAG